MDTVLLFNENTSRPVATISMKEIPTQSLHHIISSNQYLALPRLSSQSILDSLCPCEWNKPRKRLCVVLVTEDSQCHDPHRQSFRLYAQSAPYNPERVRFAYIYHSKQSDFVNSLIPSGKEIEPLLRIVIIWRRDTSQVKYEWLPDKWEIENDLNETVNKLETTISKLLKSSEALTYEAFVKDLFDEHAKGIFGRIFAKLMMFSESVYEGLSKDQVLPALSVVGTVVFIVAVGYFMAYLVRLEEESIKKQREKEGRDRTENKNPTYQPELKLHELRAEKYNGLVRLLKPGCRTIILVLDMQSRQHLIPPFHKAVWPYRKNKTLMFAYMYIERGLSWYKELLQLSLPEERDLNINPRNCVGTVLALNGHRKYFCMFHAKHPETKRKQNDKDKKSDRWKGSEKDCEAAAFIGFDTDSSESDDDVLLEGNLLDGFSNWLDRLFEGTTQRFYINYWPEFPNK
ncbi:dnaJ homolog subfamily C member 16-like [Agrilus planipennis]|nr:dnaJ homolog subfamily C member 16-like [Agrilus planipennis]